MRKSTLLWLALAAFCSVTLFHTSQGVHDSREKVESLTRKVAAEEETIRVLQAEWSYLNQPKRLEKLAKEHLKLGPLKGSQFVSVDALPALSASGPDMIADGKTKETTPRTLVTAGIKINPPAPPVKTSAPVPPSSPATTAAAGSRTMGDVLKSLGVKR